MRLQPTLRPLLLATLLALAGAASLAPAPARAQAQIPIARPEAVGLSAERLTRVSDWLRAEVAAKRIPGAVVMVMRGGKLAYVDAIGQRDPASPAPMKIDDIFRIYSMTKPIVSVAALMLAEEGKLLLEAPIARYIPAFADVKVGVEKTDAQGNKALELVAPRRPPTVQDLLRHTAGLTYGFFGDGLVKQAYQKAGISAGGDISNAEFADKIAKMPLIAQPGSTWDYSNATDVLGRVIEVASGQTLGAFLQRRIFDPLGMRDTSFYLPEPERQARLAEPFAEDRVIGVGAVVGNPRKVERMESGGGGLVSTAPDYLRFLAMLRHGGELEGRRIISPATLAFMTADHLGAGVLRTPLYLPGPGYGFGLGVAVRTSAGEAASPASVGEYYWGGAGGTYMWVDPALDLAVVFMMQSPKMRVPYRSLLRNLVAGAVIEMKAPAAR
ncbi:serine hydrolase domain-containing protein [Aquabacterium sp. OR-4]|uniref:serine hydrolase domain-containing protein n=1 Tax=Aquabacterium sp. OR-4 TaxID=2978127 RepID=UPI0021B2FC94|nr:serine hydrolase domain-containing protein [Aquabacterium sp. OR-4]MDT7833999.1 serine hydrolase domain-containing protein [Aquabacterium sp. OR-4]